MGEVKLIEFIKEYYPERYFEGMKGEEAVAIAIHLLTFYKEKELEQWRNNSCIL